MAQCNWGLKAGVAGQEVITPTLLWQLRTGVHAQIKCRFCSCFGGHKSSRSRLCSQKLVLT